MGISLGAIFGLARRQPLSTRTQLFLRNLVGGLTIIFGLRLVYQGVAGPVLTCLEMILTALIAIFLGFWIGKILGLQSISNRLGRLASNTIAAAQQNHGARAADGFNALAVLFCAAPLGIVGAVADGLWGYSYLLAVKALMDALAMAGFIKIFRWPSALAALPVFVFYSAISLAVQLCAKEYLSPPSLNSIAAAAGLIACIIAVVMFGIRKVELANYLPALAVAPLLVRLFH